MSTKTVLCCSCLLLLLTAAVSGTVDNMECLSTMSDQRFEDNKILIHPDYYHQIYCRNLTTTFTIKINNEQVSFQEYHSFNRSWFVSSLENQSFYLFLRGSRETLHNLTICNILDTSNNISQSCEEYQLLDDTGSNSSTQSEPVSIAATTEAAAPVSTRSNGQLIMLCLLTALFLTTLITLPRLIE